MPLVESLADLTEYLPMFVLRCSVAVVCGGIIGIERERKNKPAGFRTNILICLGSAIYMATGFLIHDKTADPTRIAAQVVTGIGFIGAGCIIQAGAQVHGLTTAATIWVVAAIGIVAGAGYPLLALVGAVMVVITLVVLHSIEKRFIARDNEKGE